MPRHSLWPREHGAYFQFAIPLIAACAVRPPTTAGAAWAAAACLAFLAHEPLLVVLGNRGPRAASALGAEARPRLAILAGVALALGGVALATAPAAALAVAALVIAAAGAIVALAWRRAEHSLPGELIAAVALTGAGAPVLVADGAAPSAALASWLGWAAGFAASVVAVHRVMARHKRAASRLDRALAAGLGIVAAACIAVAPAAAGSTASLVAAPLVAVAALLVIAPPPATRLRAVGATIAAAAAVSGLLAVLAG